MKTTNPYIMPGLPKNISMIDRLTIYVTENHSITIKDIKSKCRTREIVTPRHICMYILYKYTTNTLGYIGRYYGGRDHVTALHAVKAIFTYMQTESDLKKEVDKTINHFNLKTVKKIKW